MKAALQKMAGFYGGMDTSHWKNPNKPQITGKWKKPGAPDVTKLAFKLNPQGKAEVKAETHFMSEKPDWNSFVKNLKSTNFRKAILGAEQADPKLKKYVKNFGGYVASKDELARIKSKDSGKTDVVKDLHSGRWGCNCGDWQYKHSVQGGDCKHIKSVKQSKLVKAASLSMLTRSFVATGRTMNQRQKGLQAKQTMQRVNGVGG